MKNPERTAIIALLASGATAIALVAGAYVVWFWRSELSPEPEQWGQFGDFIGGVLNPFVAFLALVGLGITAHGQTKANAQVRAEHLAGVMQSIEREIDTYLNDFTLGIKYANKEITEQSTLLKYLQRVLMLEHVITSIPDATFLDGLENVGVDIADQNVILLEACTNASVKLSLLHSVCSKQVELAESDAFFKYYRVKYGHVCKILREKKYKAPEWS